MEWLIRYGGRAENVPGYDCNSCDHAHGVTNYALGTAFIAFGVTGEIIYALEMMVMLKKKYRSLSCYKIMIALGISDMSAIFLTSILTGYFWMIGANYCTNPNVMYITGALANGFFNGSSMTTFVLLINGLLEMRNKPLMLRIFKNGRTYAVLLIPLLYFLYFCFFTHPAIFNSDNAGWFFYTFLPNHRPEDYHNYPHMVNNLFVMTIIGSIGVLSFCLTPFSDGQRIITVGSEIVVPALIYLLFNSTLQREVLNLFYRGERQVLGRSYPITTRTFLA